MKKKPPYLPALAAVMGAVAGLRRQQSPGLPSVKPSDSAVRRWLKSFPPSSQTKPSGLRWRN